MRRSGPTWRIRLVTAVTVAGAMSAATLGGASAAPGPDAPTVPGPPSVRLGSAPGQSALGESWEPGRAQTAARHAGEVVPGQVLLRWNGDAPPPELHEHGVKALRQLEPGTGVATLESSDAPDAKTPDAKATAAAAERLAAVGGITAATPNRYVTSMVSDSRAVPKELLDQAAAQAAALAAPRASAATPGIPGNYGVTSSLQSWMNSGGVNALGAFSQLSSHYGQLPGQGEIITNVSLADLTDRSMADAGDPYVQRNGPTTVVRDGQRYLDLPGMALIPTYVADDAGHLDPLGSTEEQDPSNGEILLDFSVMSPLPHELQRPENPGSGYTDLLGIAPGAQYRLVVPSRPTTDRIAGALLAAARQQPRPNVINASLGFGTDTTGFAGRYLEDDPLLRSTVERIVREYGITVSIAANDGTRLYTPAAVGPDGGSTPTDRTDDRNRATGIDDDAMSTTPSLVPDSGAIAAGGTTTDDVLAAGATGPATVAETRISGSGTFSSGFGSRIDLSAPSDNIPALAHAGSTAQSVTVVLSGGTSASAPEIAAAAAVVDQTAKLTGHPLTPRQIRELLVKTARPVPTPAQIDRTLQVGPQLDLTAAVEKLLPRDRGAPHPQIARLGVAHRKLLGNYGGAFIEYTDPDAIDLAGPANGAGYRTGEGLVGPITFAADVTGAAPNTRYRLTVGTKSFDADLPSIRVTPTQLLTAAGLPVAATQPRTVSVRFDALTPGKPTASVSRTLTLGPSDGTFTEAQAPTAPATVEAGRSVTVHYDLSHVRNVKDPRLVVSTPGHWNPLLAPLFNAAWSAPLTADSGDVTVPASAFTGGGIYGIGIQQDDTIVGHLVYGEFAPIRVDGGTADQRPQAPLLAPAGGQFGHRATVTRSAPGFSLRWTTKEVAEQATGAVLEISSPAPTVFNALNTFTAQNGTGRDNDGFDAGSVVYQSLPGASGTADLNAVELGLGTSMQYNVRVLATAADGQVLGQASPSSALVLDDGTVPGGGTVADFAARGADSVAVLSGVDGRPGASVRRYDPATGTYGAQLTADSAAGAHYAVIGVDDTVHRAVLAHWNDADAFSTLEVRDLADGTETGPPARIDTAGGLLVGGRVDAARHRAWVLDWAAGDYHDELVPLDLATGILGTPVLPDSRTKHGPAYYTGIDLDPSTGTVQLAHLYGGGRCLGNASAVVVNVSEDSGALTVSPGAGPGCGTNFASAQDGGKGQLLNFPVISSNFAGSLSTVGIDEKTLATGPTTKLRSELPLALAVDSAHHVALVAYPSPLGASVYGVPGNVMTDSNSTSQIDVVDLDSGAVLKTLSAFDFIGGFGGPLASTTGANVQLDPATRTGFTYGPYREQITRFTY
ncbi:S8 family serine peptidase [Kitasatospora sp. NPDC088134]|uniref:S8 family serine peptidase n=1 Tax=Kitasatospora sp. NPDC088134 TaxID=3364071 RepID=UPI00381596E6